MCLKDRSCHCPHGVRLSAIGRRRSYIDSDRYERWGRPRLLIAVRGGAAEGFSFEGAREFTS
jgi:uncharacterized protein (DUF779 family)